MRRPCRSAQLLAVVALAILVSQDATTGRETKTPTDTAKPAVREVQLVSENPPDVTLSCSVEREEQRIRIHYLLSNQSKRTILTFDRVQFRLKTLKLPVDVVCDAGDGFVNLVLGLSPNPVFGMMRGIVEREWQQELSRLGPSQNMAASVSLALPLLEWDEWHALTTWSTVAKADQAVEVHTARLVIDFVRPDRTVHNPRWPAGSAESVWCAIPLSPPVTLLRHPGLGEFDDPTRRAAFNLGPDKVQSWEASYAGAQERHNALQQRRAYLSTPGRRGTSPAGLPKRWQLPYLDDQD
jgi:hypothetical protein